jgi:hypothetical protein
MNIRPVEAELFHVDGRMDGRTARDNEADSLNFADVPNTNITDALYSFPLNHATCFAVRPTSENYTSESGTVPRETSAWVPLCNVQLIKRRSCLWFFVVKWNRSVSLTVSYPITLKQSRLKFVKISSSIHSLKTVCC